MDVEKPVAVAAPSVRGGLETAVEPVRGIDGFADRLSAFVADMLHMAAPDRETNLLDLGANSIHVIRLANRIETELGVRPDVDELFELPTIKAIAAYYTRQPEANAVVGPIKQSSGSGVATAGENVIVDFDERERFKNERRGLRRDLEMQPEVCLPQSVADRDQIEEVRR